MAYTQSNALLSQCQKCIRYKNRFELPAKSTTEKTFIDTKRHSLIRAHLISFGFKSIVYTFHSVYLQKAKYVILLLTSVLVQEQYL